MNTKNIKSGDFIVYQYNNDKLDIKKSFKKKQTAIKYSNGKMEVDEVFLSSDGQIFISSK